MPNPVHIRRVAERPPWNRTDSVCLFHAWLEGLNCAANALLKGGISHSKLRGLLAEHIVRVERETGRRVEPKNGSEDDVWFAFAADGTTDQIRTKKPNEVRLLDARINGVLIQANLNKPGKYHHDNLSLGGSLRKLAEMIEEAPHELADADVEFEQGSWKRRGA